MEKEKSVWRLLGVILAFWGLMLFGPMLIRIFIYFARRIAGEGYSIGSISYKIIAFVSQPIACFIAHETAKDISRDKHDVCVLVNEIVAACLFCLFVILFVLIQSDLWSTLNQAASAAAIIYCAVNTARGIS